MQTNPNKVKFIITLAIVLIVILLTVSIFLLVKINIANNTLSEQEKQIEFLQHQIDNNNHHSQGLIFPNLSICLTEV